MSKSEYNVREDGDNFILEQKHYNTMDLNETLKTMAKIDQDIVMGKKDLEKREKEIEDKFHEKNLELARDQLAQVELLKVKINEVLKPKIEELTQKVKADIKVLKAKHGYSRIKKDGNQKIALSSSIMSEVAVKYDLDVGYPFMRKIRAEFDKI